MHGPMQTPIERRLNGSNSTTSNHSSTQGNQLLEDCMDLLCCICDRVMQKPLEQQLNGSNSTTSNHSSTQGDQLLEDYIDLLCCICDRVMQKPLERRLNGSNSTTSNHSSTQGDQLLEDYIDLLCCICDRVMQGAMQHDEARQIQTSILGDCDGLTLDERAVQWIVDELTNGEVGFSIFVLRQLRTWEKALLRMFLLSVERLEESVEMAIFNSTCQGQVCLAMCEEHRVPIPVTTKFMKDLLDRLMELIDNDG